jgi:hypothetical protein
VAWIIGWDLLIEYAIGNIAVAISWSDYFTGLLASLRIPALGIDGIVLPSWTTMDFVRLARLSCDRRCARTRRDARGRQRQRRPVEVR